MEQMFRTFFEKLIGFISLLIVTGLIATWSIDIQRKAASQKALGLISLKSINQHLMRKR